MMKFLIENYVTILAALGAFVSAATMITAITPNKKDDAVVGKLRAFLDIVSIKKQGKK